MLEKIELLNQDTGEIIEANSIVRKNQFDTNFNISPRVDAEKNTGDYLVDDTDYVDLEVLIQRTKRNNPRQYNDIQNGSMADMVYMRPQDVQDYFMNLTRDDDKDEVQHEVTPEVAGVDEDPTGDVAPQQQAESNPVGVDPAATGDGAAE